MGQGPRRDRPEQDRHQGQVLASPRELQLVRQRRRNDCGLAALATVAAYHSRSFDYADFANEGALERDGTDLLTLARIAEGLGFRTRGVKASYDAIPNCPLPAIAHLRRPLGGGHFVVVQRWTPEHVVLADPAVGMRKMPRATFCRRATGYLLVIADADPVD